MNEDEEKNISDNPEKKSMKWLLAIGLAMLLGGTLLIYSQMNKKEEWKSSNGETNRTTDSSTTVQSDKPEEKNKGTSSSEESKDIAKKVLDHYQVKEDSESVIAQRDLTNLNDAKKLIAEMDNKQDTTVQTSFTPAVENSKPVATNTSSQKIPEIQSSSTTTTNHENDNQQTEIGPPIIYLKQDSVVEKGKSINFENYFYVLDANDVSPKIFVDTSMYQKDQSGNQRIRITAFNKYGKQSSAQLTLYVNAKPHIQMKKGYSKIKITRDNPYFNIRDYIEAIDEEDGNISQNLIVVENKVNIKIAGSYNVSVKIKDSKGYSDFKTFEVEVVERENTVPVFDTKEEQIFTFVLGEKVNTSKILSEIKVKDKEDTFLNFVTKKELSSEDMTKVDSEKEGFYAVTVTATDYYGEVAKKVIIVEVKAKGAENEQQEKIMKTCLKYLNQKVKKEENNSLAKAIYQDAIRLTAEEFDEGKEIDVKDAKAGDLLKNEKSSKYAIYLNDSQCFSFLNGEIKISNYQENEYEQAFCYLAGN